MIGTAIRKSFGLIVRAAGLRVAGGCVGARPVRVYNLPAARGFGLRRSAAPRGLTVFFLVAFVLGSVVCSPAAHRWLDADADQPVSAQAMSEVAKSAAGHQTPAKGAVGGLCTGHCTSHSIALPAVFIASATPLLKQAGWPVENDQWAQASAPARLERPPRI
jgi:hypothetical protein